MKIAASLTSRAHFPRYGKMYCRRRSVSHHLLSVYAEKAQSEGTEEVGVMSPSIGGNHEQQILDTGLSTIFSSFECCC